MRGEAPVREAELRMAGEPPCRWGQASVGRAYSVAHSGVHWLNDRQQFIAGPSHGPARIDRLDRPWLLTRSGPV